MPSLTTKDVCDHVVKPATETQQCAYIDLLHGQQTSAGAPLLAAANIFVSHAWKYDFKLVLSILENITQTEAKPIYFWFDLVINNQHGTVDRPFEWWCTTFKSSIESIGRVVLILAPWRDPIPLTRAWCLWELFSAATPNVATLIVKLLL